MKLLRRILLYGLLAAVAVGLVLYAFLPQPVEVDLANVTVGPLQVTVNEDGKTRIKERYSVSAPLAGELLRVDLHVGDSVRAGETVLAMIEPSDPSLLDARSQAEAEARVSAAEARFSHTQAQLDRALASYSFAQKEYARAERLLPSNAVSQAEYEKAEHLLRTATEDKRVGEFAVQIARYELEQAKAAAMRTRGPEHTEQDRFEVRSPINGEVLRVFQESGGPIAPGTQIMELGDRGNLEVEIDVLSSDAVRIPPGAKVFLEHSGLPLPLVARVRLIEPQGYMKVSALGVEEQRVNVIADFTDAPEVRRRLGDAYRVDARVVIWEAEKVLKVNAGAIFRHDGGWAVYKIVDGRARLTKVEVGQSSGLETEVVKGLQPGDQVVAYPSNLISDGVRVRSRPTRR